MLGQPSLGQVHGLAPTALVTVAPVLGTPVLASSGMDALAPANYVGQTPIVDVVPELACVPAGTTVSLTASALVTSAPVFGPPTIGQTHAVAAAPLTPVAPIFGQPTLGQAHTLTAAALTASAPIFAAPLVGQAHALGATAIVTAAPVFGAPLIGQKAALAATALVTAAPTLATATIGQTHGLSGIGLVPAAPILATPSLVETNALVATALRPGTPSRYACAGADSCRKRGCADHRRRSARYANYRRHRRVGIVPLDVSSSAGSIRRGCITSNGSDRFVNFNITRDHSLARGAKKLESSRTIAR